MTDMSSGHAIDSVKKTAAVRWNNDTMAMKHFHGKAAFASEFTSSRNQRLDTESSFGQTALEKLNFDFRGERRGSACHYVQSPIHRRRKRLRGSNFFDSRTDLSHSLARESKPRTGLLERRHFVTLGSQPQKKDLLVSVR